MAVDMDKLHAFLGRFIGDLGATVHAGMVVIGEKLGLYKALADGPLTSAELADEDENRRTICARVARLAGRGRLCRVRGENRQIQPNRGASLCAGVEDSPAYIPGAFQVASRVAGGSSADRRLLSHGCRDGLARTSRRRVSRHREIFSSRLCGESC